MKLLVVEDEPIIGLELVLVAEDLGFDVAGPATDTASALTLASNHPPDIALVDVNLTDGPTGPTIAAHLASAFDTAMVIVSTSLEDIAPGKDGVFAILGKPTKEEELISMLSNLSAGRTGANR